MQHAMTATHIAYTTAGANALDTTPPSMVPTSAPKTSTASCNPVRSLVSVREREL